MSAPFDAAPDIELIGTLLGLASRWTGVSAGAIHAENIRRAASAWLARGLTQQQLLSGAEAGQPPIVESLRQAVSIGETYFFRYPEQFQLVEQRLRNTPPPASGAPWRAWSAGCATGEEAYSIAALLHHLQEPGMALPSVLGTDHLASHIEAARTGRYRRWSVRESGPIAYPLFHELDPDRVAIRPELEAMVRFEVHNLLHPAPAHGFDLIFCRNVLIYYDPPAIARVVENLGAALAPQGILVFGLSDPVAAPAGLTPVGPPTLRAFTRATATSPAPRRDSVASKARPASAGASPKAMAATNPPPPRTETDPVAMHVEALHLLEQGERPRSEALLARIRQSAPDYLPACLELALLHAQQGRSAAARACLGELLDKLTGLPEDQVLAGPERLAVSYYRAAGQALLAQQRAGGAL